MSRSADWRLRLDADAWTLHGPDGMQRLALDGAPETVLAGCEPGKAGGGGKLSVILGDAWLRYLVLVWPLGMRRNDERRSFMAHRFRQVHEAGEPEWVLTMDAAVADYPALACAVPAGLLAAVLDFAELRALTPTSITGDFPAVFNASRAGFAEPPGTLTAFALLRGHRLSVGLWRDGAWLALRSQNVADRGASALAALLKAWSSEFVPAGAESLLYAVGEVAEVTAPWRCIRVEAP